MHKRIIGRAILPISIVAVVVLLWGQIYPSSSPFISEKIVECPLGAFQQNPVPGLSIQIQAGAISPYNLSVFFSLLRDVGFAREAFPLRPQVKWASREKTTGEERRSPGKGSPMKLSLSGKVEGIVELNELLALLGKKIPFAGEMDLPMPGLFLPAIRITQGTARVDLERVNDDRGMSFRGRIEISGGAVEVPSVNQRFSAVNGEISLEGNRIRVVSLTAEIGGGLLEVQGDMEQERGRLTSLDLTFQGMSIFIKSRKYSRVPLPCAIANLSFLSPEGRHFEPLGTRSGLPRRSYSGASWASGPSAWSSCWVRKTPHNTTPVGKCHVCRSPFSGSHWRGLPFNTVAICYN